MLELQKHGSELEAHLHKALESSHDATSKLASAQATVEAKENEITSLTQEVNLRCVDKP